MEPVTAFAPAEHRVIPSGIDGAQIMLAKETDQHRPSAKPALGDDDPPPPRFGLDDKTRRAMTKTFAYTEIQTAAQREQLRGDLKDASALFADVVEKELQKLFELEVKHVLLSKDEPRRVDALVRRGLANSVQSFYRYIGVVLRPIQEIIGSLSDEDLAAVGQKQVLEAMKLLGQQEQITQQLLEKKQALAKQLHHLKRTYHRELTWLRSQVKTLTDSARSSGQEIPEMEEVYFFGEGEKKQKEQLAEDEDEVPPLQRVQEALEDARERILQLENEKDALQQTIGKWQRGELKRRGKKGQTDAVQDGSGDKSGQQGDDFDDDDDDDKDEIIRRLEEEIADLNKEAFELRKAVEGSAPAGRKTQAKGAVGDQTNDPVTLRKELDDLQKQNATLKDEKDALAAELEEKNRKFDKVHADMENRRRELVAARQKLKELGADVDQLDIPDMSQAPQYGKLQLGSASDAPTSSTNVRWEVEYRDRPKVPMKNCGVQTELAGDIGTVPGLRDPSGSGAASVQNPGGAWAAGPGLEAIAPGIEDSRRSGRRPSDGSVGSVGGRPTGRKGSKESVAYAPSIPQPPGWRPGMKWPADMGPPPPGWKVGDAWPRPSSSGSQHSAHDSLGSGMRPKSSGSVGGGRVPSREGLASRGSARSAGSAHSGMQGLVDFGSPPSGWRPGMAWPSEMGLPPMGWKTGDPWPQVAGYVQSPPATPPAGWRPGMSWPSDMGPPPVGWKTGDPWPRGIVQTPAQSPPAGWRPGMSWPSEMGPPPPGWQVGDPWPLAVSRGETPPQPPEWCPGDPWPAHMGPPPVGWQVGDPWPQDAIQPLPPPQPLGWRPGMDWPVELGPPPAGWRVGDPWPEGHALTQGPPPDWRPGMEWPAEMGSPPPGWRVGDPWPQQGGIGAPSERFSTTYHMYRRLAPPVHEDFAPLPDEKPSGLGGAVSIPTAASTFGDDVLPDLTGSMGGRVSGSRRPPGSAPVPSESNAPREQKHWAPLPVRWHHPDGMLSRHKGEVGGGHLRGGPLPRGGGWQYLTSAHGNRRAATGSRELMESTSASQSLESGTEDVGINSEVAYENQVLRRRIAQLEKELKRMSADPRKQISEMEKKFHQAMARHDRPNRGMRRGWPMTQSSGALMDGI